MNREIEDYFGYFFNMLTSFVSLSYFFIGGTYFESFFNGLNNALKSIAYDEGHLTDLFGIYLAVK